MPARPGKSHPVPWPPVRLQASRRALRFSWVLLSLALAACRKDASESPAPASAPRLYAVEYVSGKLVEFADSANGEWRALKPGDTLRGGQCVRTSYESSALLKGNYGDQVFLMELCRVVLDPDFLRKYAGAGEPVRGIQVLSGKSWLKVAKGHGSFLGKTPGGLVKVKGTRFSLSYDAKKEKTQVVLEQGSVVVTRAGRERDSIDLLPGQSLDWIKDAAQPVARAAEPADLAVPPPLQDAPSGGASGWEAPGPMDENPDRRSPTGSQGGRAGSRRLDSVEQGLEASVQAHGSPPIPGASQGGTPPPSQDPRAEFEAAKQEKYEAAKQARSRIEDSIRSKLDRTGSGTREMEAFDELDRETGP